MRVWIGASGARTIEPGKTVQLYVEVAEEGYLVVLRAATDGRVEVLFPGQPQADSHITPGTYELRRAGDQPAFVATEPVGSGLVLAALSPAPFRFDEFVRAGTWDSHALVASWSGADPEATLADIVQRMLGDGYFNYDVVTYYVDLQPYAFESVPASPLATPAQGPCTGCAFAGETLIEPMAPLVCDPFFTTCFTFGPVFPFGPFFPRRTVESGICSIGTTCPEGVGTSAIALASPARSQARVATRGELARLGATPPPLRPAAPASPPPPARVPPRSRVPDAAGAAAAGRAARIVPLSTVRPLPTERPRVATRRRAVGAGDAAVATRARLTLPRLPMLAPATEVPVAQPTSPAPTPAGLVPLPSGTAAPVSEGSSPPEGRTIAPPPGLAMPARSATIVRRADATRSAPAGATAGTGEAAGTAAAVAGAPRGIALPRVAGPGVVAGRGEARAGARVAGTTPRRR